MLDALSLDTVLFVVANEPWQKSGGRQITAAEDRYAMVAAAVADVAGLEPSRIEIDRGGPSYTVDTLVQLASDETELFLIVGTTSTCTTRAGRRCSALATLSS